MNAPSQPKAAPPTDAPPKRPPLDAAGDARFRTDLVAAVPMLRAFARGLAGNRELADDLAQETLMKAWGARASFTPGTNFRAWLFRILRNHFYTVAHVAKRYAELDPEVAERTLVAPAAQESSLMLADLRRGLLTLPAEQREALLLMESGLQWEEIASVMGCPLGTVKSRITRGRAALTRYMDGAPDDKAAAPGKKRDGRTMTASP